MARLPARNAAEAIHKDLPWEGAIQQVLLDAGGALHYGEITDRIIALGLRSSVGATPKDSVAAILSNSLREKSSPYLKVGRGVYALKSTVQVAGSGKGAATATQDTEEKDPTGAVKAFGMFWQRASVYWPATRPKLLGRQNAGSERIDFSDQVGVYLLHDRERVIYVGRAGDTLSGRLKAHTIDRLGGRWDRFSWFGLRSVSEDATLSAGIVSWTQEVVISTMEALLIESLEPPLNRKRGDSFSATEYLQAFDPQVEAEQAEAMMRKLLKRQST